MRMVTFSSHLNPCLHIIRPKPPGHVNFWSLRLKRANTVDNKLLHSTTDNEWLFFFFVLSFIFSEKLQKKKSTISARVYKLMSTTVYNTFISIYLVIEYLHKWHSIHSIELVHSVEIHVKRESNTTWYHFFTSAFTKGLKVVNNGFINSTFNCSWNKLHLILMIWHS